MKIRTNYDHTRPRDRTFSAIDLDTYDGSEDSTNRHMIGWGSTSVEAIDDLMRLLQEQREYEQESRK